MLYFSHRYLLLFLAAGLLATSPCSLFANCPRPNPATTIGYDDNCWLQYSVDITEVSEFARASDSFLLGSTNAFTTRLTGYVFDDSVGGSRSVSVSQTGSHSEEWHNLPNNGTAGGSIKLTLQGRGKGSVTMLGHAAQAHGYLQLRFESNILGHLPWKGEVTTAATTRSSGGPIGLSVPGPHGATVSVQIPSVFGLGDHPAIPFDLGVKRKKACNDEWTFNQVGTFNGRMEANGNWLYLRTGHARMCFYAWFRLKAKLSCGC
ncbi:MAG: hypothetical protein AAF581_15140 [Planctomycetota bacterium]